MRRVLSSRDRPHPVPDPHVVQLSVKPEQKVKCIDNTFEINAMTRVKGPLICLCTDPGTAKIWVHMSGSPYKCVLGRGLFGASQDTNVTDGGLGGVTRNKLDAKSPLPEGLLLYRGNRHRKSPS